MSAYKELDISKQLVNAIDDLGYVQPTPIQVEAYPVILSGKDVVGVAQTGTGKTFAYMLPVLKDLKYSKDGLPRVVVLVPTRELVLQVVEQIQSYTKYTSLRVLGVYGGVNMKTQRKQVVEGLDILVATPARIYDLAISGTLVLKQVTKLIIDEVDIMLDLGYRFQLTNIFDLLPARRQNIMFSATMTDEVDALIDDFFSAPIKISVALSGTPLDNISQTCYSVLNFNTKINLLQHLLIDADEYKKVLIFVSHKLSAERLYEALERKFGLDVFLTYANKSQTIRMNALERFEEGKTRILISTDLLARGIDLSKISHVISFDAPRYPENYMHRIGRTGRAEEQGKSILFFTSKEEENKYTIEKMMKYKIPIIEFPEAVAINYELIPEERPKIAEDKKRDKEFEPTNPAFHEKSEKNKKTNPGGSYKWIIAAKYKKPKTRGDKNFNQRFKKK